MEEIEAYLYILFPDDVFYGFIIVFLILLLMAFLLRAYSIRKIITYAILLEYIVVVICNNIVYREETGSRELMLDPFWKFRTFNGSSMELLGEMALNIILFLPLGIIMRFITSGRNRYVHVIIVSLLLSVFIEVMQYCLCRGLCETDDVIHNTLGAVLGFVFFDMLLFIYSKWRGC